MKLIVGLGNPGRGYANTRHNIGFQLLDYIADNKGLAFSREKFNAKYCEYNFNGEKVILVKPLSYMNLSGSVIAEFVSFYKIKLNDILVIHDDLDMKLGRVKITYNSSCGGHNGVRDIERCLGTKSYARLKIGISKDKNIDTKDYVLGFFTSDEKLILDETYKLLAYVVDDFCSHSLEKLMCKYNHK